MTLQNKTLPTDTELTLLRFLWENGPSTVREVREGLGSTVGYTTVLTLLQIMLAKGLVVRDETGTAHAYSAKEPQERTEKRIVTNLMDQLFDGSPSRLIQRSLSPERASKEELDAIRALLTSARDKSRK